MSDPGFRKKPASAGRERLDERGISALRQPISTAKEALRAVAPGLQSMAGSQIESR